MRTRDMLRAARRDGAAAGKAAASWVFDGNTTTETYRLFLKGWEKGDPAVLDAYAAPGRPDGPDMADRYGLTDTTDPHGNRLDVVCGAWQEAADGAYWAELERVARYHTAADTNRRIVAEGVAMQEAE